MWKSFKGLLVLGLVFLGTIGEAQDNSVYSRYGVGLLGETNSIASRSMGGLGASYSSTEHINFTNPASYAKLNLISFAVHLVSKFCKSLSSSATFLPSATVRTITPNPLGVILFSNRFNLSFSSLLSIF